MEEQKKARADLENILNAVATSARDAIIMMDSEGLIFFWNHSASVIFGYSPEEAIGKNLHFLLAPTRFHEGFLKAFPRFQVSGEGSAVGKTLELRALRKNGEEFPIELSLSAIYIRDSWHALGIIRDITARKQEEEEMKRNWAILRTLIDNLPVTTYVKDAEARKIVANEADWKLMGYGSEKEVIGKTDLELFDSGIGNRGYQDDMEVIREGKTVVKEEDFIDPEGRQTLLHTTKVPLRNEHGEIIGLVGIGHDITERKAMEVQLLEQTEQLRAGNAEKDKFFSIIAHDLRSPFNGFLGLLKLMEDTLPSMTQQEIFSYVQALRGSAANLFRLLENLLEWSQMQRGQITLQQVPFRIKSKAMVSCELLIEAALSKGISISCDIKEDLVVVADENMVDSILRNLVGNAIKFTSSGGKIVVSARKTGTGFVEISVTDTGIGIPPGLIDHLFRLDVNTKRKGTEGEPSSGLGLILVKEFVESNGGQLFVESREGSGSTFRFTLPEAEPTDSIPGHPAEDSEQPVRKGLGELVILVVDDDIASNLMLAVEMKRYGKEILRAESGKEAIRICSERPDIDLILMDISMPGMDGYIATQYIRQIRQDAVIIVQTAVIEVGGEAKARKAGCNEYLMKPLDMDEMREALERYFPHS